MQKIARVHCAHSQRTQHELAVGQVDVDLDWGLPCPEGASGEAETHIIPSVRNMV